MVTNNCVVSSKLFTILFVVLFVNFGTNSALRTLFVEELCYGSGGGAINLSIQKSVILTSVPTEEQNCKIRVTTDRFSSLVVAFYRYHLRENDSLTFSDRHNFKLSLAGEGYFVDERKYVTLETPVNIHYITQHLQTDTKLKFQIVLTQINDGPCNWDDYKCKNNKCISKSLACDQHNHCGDLDPTDRCTPAGSFEEVVTSAKATKTSPMIILVGVIGAILIIVIVAFIIGVVRTCNKNKKTPRPATLPTVASTVQPSQPVHQASVLNRIRQSFRGIRQPTAPPHPESAGQHSESCEVPSMYPKLPANVSGVDNPDFKRDE